MSVIVARTLSGTRCSQGYHGSIPGVVMSKHGDHTITCLAIAIIFMVLHRRYAEALSAERRKFVGALSEALSTERRKSAEALSAERRKSAEALSAERRR